MIANYRANHVLFQEPTLKDSRLSEKDRITGGFMGSFPASKMTRDNNIHRGSQRVRKYGGIAILVVSNSTTKISKTDTDLTGLGKWCYPEI